MEGGGAMMILRKIQEHVCLLVILLINTNITHVAVYMYMYSCTCMLVIFFGGWGYM